MQRAVLLSLIAACAHSPGPSAPAPPQAAPATVPASPALPEGPPLVTPGEHMQYRLSLQGVELATYDLAVGDVADLGSRRAIVVQGHAKVRGLASFIANIDDHFTSWVDVATGRSLRFQTDEYASGSKTNIEHSIIDLAGRTGDLIPVTYHVNDAAPQPEPQKASLPVAWDYNAFLIALRGWEGPPGTELTLEVFRSRFLWHVEVTIHGREKLTTELGALPALRIDGKTYKLKRDGTRAPDDSERRFSMWISDDDGRVPLQIKAVTDYGDLKMQIVDYQPGNGARLRP